MAIIEFQTRKFQSGEILSNVEVIAKWNILGVPLEHKIFTDAKGEGKLDVGATSANVLFTGKRGLLRFIKTYEVNVGLFGIGVTPPNPQVFYMKEEVTAPVTDVIDGAVDYVKNVGSTATLVFAVVAGITLSILAYRFITSGEVFRTAGKAAGGAKKAAKGALSGVK